MSNLLPLVLNKYFSAANSSDIDEAAACFTADAEVLDESETHSGPAAIRAWIAEAKQKYQYTSEVKHFTQRDDVTLVTAVVTGNFPGSPIDLDYAFTLSGDGEAGQGKIRKLVIE